MSSDEKKTARPAKAARPKRKPRRRRGSRRSAQKRTVLVTGYPGFIGKRLVRTLLNESLEAGHHDVIWTGKDQAGRPVASGAYFYRLRAADGSVQSGRMVLVK